MNIKEHTIRIHFFLTVLLIFVSIGEAAAFANVERASKMEDNGPVLELMDDVTVCSGSAILLAELPIVETTGVPVDYSYYLEPPPSNPILAANLVVTSNDTVYVQADDGACTTVLEVPIEFVLSPILTTTDVITVCSGEEVDLSSLDIQDIENTGMPITFHTSNNPSSGNIITDLSINPTISTSVYAYSQLGVCEYVLPIPINVTPTPNLFVTTEPVICSGLDLDLSTLLLSDLNNTGAPISVHSGLPGTAANEITDDVVNYTSSTTIYAVAQSGNCLTELPINVTVTSSLYAGEDNQGQGCEGVGDYDLTQLVTPNSNPGTFMPIGTIPYFDPITNTFDTDASPAGIYNFEYVVDGEGSCMADIALLELEIIKETSAGTDNFREICEGISGPVNMGQFLNAATSSNGNWRQLTGPPIDVSDPFNVDFSLIPSDTLIFQYVINEPAECKADTSIITIDVTPAPILDGTQLRCSDDLNSYTFVFWTDYTDVSVDFGSIQQVGGEFQVQNIPITQSINITLVNEKNCSNTIHINPPECDCAFVPLPVSVNSVSVCQGQPVPPLNVVLPLGVGANWYDAPVDGNLLFANGTAYNPSINAIGNYTFYVEVYSLSDNSCVNESRIPLTLDIFDYPPDFPLDVFGCQTDNKLIFDFAKNRLSLDPTGTTNYDFYLSEADAMNNLNPLPDDFEIDMASLNAMYVVIEYGGGCQTVVPAVVEINPNPNVTFGTDDISCEDISGGVFVINNDPTQDISFSYNYQDFSSVLEVNNLFGGNAFLQAQNEYGCIVDEWVAVEVQTGFEITPYDAPECDGNGTPSDPTDDYSIWTFLLETETASTEFEVINSGTGESYGIYQFGQDAVIQVPVDGSWYILEFIDQLDPECSESVTLGNLETCSDQCGITDIQIKNIWCNDNNTPENPFDDKFYLDVDVFSVNASDSWILDGPLQFTGSYIDVQTVGPFDIEDHSGTLIFQDNLSSDCFYELSFDVPEPCSNACEVGLVEFTPTACDDAFTGPISEDDIYNVAFIFENLNIGKTEYFIELDGDTLGPFIYDELIEIQGVVAPTSDLTIIVFDAENQICLDDFTVALTPCSECNETTNIITDTLNLNCVADPEIPQLELSLSGQAEWFDVASNTLISTELNPGIDQLGLFEVVVNHDNLCVSSDTLEVVQENVIPEADAGLELIVNCFDTIVTLQGATTHPSDILYEWYDENNVLLSSNDTGDYSTSQEGVYYLSVIDTLRKCVSTFSETEIFRDDALPEFSVDIFPSDTLTCYSEEIEINAFEDLSGHNVFWVVGNDTFDQDSLVVNAIGEYEMQVMNLNNGCVQSVDFEIYKNADYPLVDIAFPDTLNCINDIIELDGTLSSVEPSITNQWYSDDFENILGEQDLTLEVDKGGTYYLELSNSENGCVEVDSIVVIQDQILPNISAGQDDYIKCYEEDYQLNGTLLTSLENYTVNWLSSEANELSNNEILNPIISDTGTYFLQVVNNVNYCVSMDTINVFEDPYLIHSIEVFSDDPLCYLDENGIIIVQDVETNGTNVQYYFNGQVSPNDNMLDGQVGGAFEIEIINDEGCSYDTLVTLIDPYVLTLDLNTEEEEIINLGDSLDIIASTNILPENIATIDWTNPESHTNPNELTTSIYPYSSTTYEIVVTDENGCVISNSLTVFVTEQVYLYFPNIFSLSGENENSEFMILGDRQVEEITLFEIYDRWGNKVFQSENFRPGEAGSGWDGRVQGIEAASGVYIYRVEVTLKNGKQKFFVGDVTLVK